MADDPKPSWFSWLPFGGLLLIVLWLPLPYGSNVSWTVAALGGLVFTLIAIWAIGLMAGKVSIPRAVPANTWMLLLWAGWLGWIFWQMSPPYGPPISIMRENTYQQFVTSGTFFGLYLLVLLTVTGSTQLRILAIAIVIAGLVQALYGSLMVLSGLEWGVLGKKVTQLGRATGTFINRNHLAGYLEVCAAVGVGLVVADLRAASTGRGWRRGLRDFVELMFSTALKIRVFLVMMVIALVLTQSRMGNIAYFSALLVCGSIYILLRERRLFVPAVLLFISFFAVDLLIISESFGLDRLLGRLKSTAAVTETRAYVMPELMRAVDDYWRTGAGLGNFSLAILPYRKVASQDYYDHAHNDFAEFMIEVGLFGCILLAGMALLTGVHALAVMLRRRSRLPAGIGLAALMSLVAIGIHSTVDFNLQIPATAATLVIVMAMSNACSSRSRRRSGEGNREPGEHAGPPVPGFSRSAVRRRGRGVYSGP